jgi:flagellar FliL protein
MASKTAVATPPPGSEAVTGEAPPNSRKKLLWSILGLVVLVSGVAGGWYFWQGSQAAAAPKEKTPARAPLIYLALEPPFVANFEEGQPARFLQIDVRVASRSVETIELIRANEPLLRNDLLLLYGAQDAGALGRREGKEKLRAESLETIRRIVKDLQGDPKSVESVLFASFVMQ